MPSKPRSNTFDELQDTPHLAGHTVHEPEDGLKQPIGFIHFPEEQKPKPRRKPKGWRKDRSKA